MSLGKDSQMHERAIRQWIDGVDIAPVQTQVADTRVHPRARIFFQKLRRGNEGIAWPTSWCFIHDFAPREAGVFYPQFVAIAPQKNSWPRRAARYAIDGIFCPKDISCDNPERSDQRRNWTSRSAVLGGRRRDQEMDREVALGLPFRTVSFPPPSNTTFPSFRRSRLILVARSVHSFFASWRKS